MKNVKATTVSYDYYHNGTPGSKPAAAYTSSNNREAAEDADPDCRPTDNANE